MENFTKKSTKQKIILTMIIVILVNFIIPQRAYADDNQDFSLAGTLVKEIVQLVCNLGDVAMGLLNKMMLGVDKVGDVMLDADKDINLEPNQGSWLAIDTEGEEKIAVTGPLGGGNFQVPNMLYSPETIFSNSIAALDVNFLSPNTYQPVSTGNEKAEDRATSAAADLGPTISKWYKALRNIAIVGLLSVLIYIGIRIIISSTAADKAKYKESLKDWFVALCLVFIIHFLMSGILMLTDKCTDLFALSEDNAITISATDGAGKTYNFRTNLVGYARVMTETKDWYEVTAYGIIYLVLVIYTWIFTFIYLKRLLYMAFFTMIAPMVALTYPLDKMGDSKAQAFNIWFKEYTMNAIIQPVHLILYTVFVSTSLDLAKDNMLYAIVAIGFLIPAEKFIKKMFGLDKSETTGNFGSFAGGALAMQGLNKASSLIKGSSKSSKTSTKTLGGDSAGSADGSGKIFKQPVPKMQDAFGGRGNSGNDGQNGQGATAMPAGNVDSDGNINTLFGTNNVNGDDGNIDPALNDPNYMYMHPDEYDENGNWLLGNTTPGLGQGQQMQIDDNDNNSIRTPNNGNPQPVDGWRKRRLKRGAKRAGKMMYKGAKLASAIGGGAMGATVGLAAGISTGDPSKAFTFTAAGAMAGGTIGKGVAAVPDRIIDAGKSMGNKVEEARYNKDIDKYGVDVANARARERINSKFNRKYMRDTSKDTHIAKLAAEKKLKETDINKIKEGMLEYLNSGFSEEQAMKALRLEEKYGGIGGENHQKVMAIADAAKDWSREYITDEKKNEQFKKQMEKELPNNRAAQQEVEQMLADYHGVNVVYGNNSNNVNRNSRRNGNS